MLIFLLLRKARYCAISHIVPRGCAVMRVNGKTNGRGENVSLLSEAQLWTGWQKLGQGIRGC